MSKRKLIILSSVFFALALYTYIVEVRIGKSDELKKEAAEKLSNIKSEDIKEIIVQDNEKKSFYSLVKDGTDWTIKPSNKKAEQAIVNEMISVFTSKADSTIVEGDKIDVTPYGVLNPKLAVEVKTSKEDYKMQFGDSPPVGDLKYLFLPGTKKIVTVPSLQLNKFRKEITELRDKRISSIPKYSIVNISIVNKGKTLELKKENGIWSLVKPVKALADNSAVSTVIDRLSSLEVDKYFDVKNKYKITVPDIKVVLITASQDEKAKASEAFTFKKETDKKKEEKYYGSYAREAETFFIRKDMYDALGKDLNSFRKKDLFTFNKGDEEKIIIKDNKGVLTLAKSGAEWVNEKKLPVSKSKIGDLLGNINAINVKEFVADNTNNFTSYGIGKNSTKISVLGPNKESSVELSFGNETKDGVYVRLNNENAVYLIEKDILAKINSDVFSYLDIEQPEKK